MLALCAFAAAGAAGSPAAGLYALTQKQDQLIRIDTTTGKNTTVGMVALPQHYFAIGPQQTTIAGSTMYVLALNSTSIDYKTNLVGLSLTDGSIVHTSPTPLLQASGEIGLGITIDAVGASTIVITGVDTESTKHTSWTVDTTSHKFTKTSDGFLDGAKYLLDDAHCLDVQASIETKLVYWLTSPSANYTASGLFDLVSIDLQKGTETGRFTLSPAQMPHAMRVDPVTGDLLAFGLDAALEPFVFTIEPGTYKTRIKASLNASSVFNGISAWDPATRTLYGLADESQSVHAPVLVSYSAASGAASKPLPICEGGYGCAVPFNFDYFDGGASSA
jgi:hypothetical protein